MSDLRDDADGVGRTRELGTSGLDEGPVDGGFVTGFAVNLSALQAMQAHMQRRVDDVSAIRVHLAKIDDVAFQGFLGMIAKDKFDAALRAQVSAAVDAQMSVQNAARFRTLVSTTPKPIKRTRRDSMRPFRINRTQARSSSRSRTTPPRCHPAHTTTSTTPRAD